MTVRPALAALALRRGQAFRVQGAAELRVKESDRIREILRIAWAFGVHGRESDDGFELPAHGGLQSPGVLRGGPDHRIAGMALICALGCTPPPRLEELASLEVSFPELPGLLKLATQEDPHG